MKRKINSKINRKMKRRKHIKKTNNNKYLKTGFIKFLAWTLPIILILAVLYVNFLPFGFHKEYSITINDDGSIQSSSSQIFLQDLKGKIITNLADVYSYGQINLVVNPKVVLRNARISVSIINSNESEVYLAKTDFNASENNWDYSWDFSKGIPLPLNGTAKYNKEKGCVYFNASNNETLSYPNSKDMFEKGSFIVYAEWMPENTRGKAQQIIGHYNWELWQNNDSVSFMVGRLINQNGSMPLITYIINSTFFNKTHEAVAVYFPDQNNSKGYLELWVDNQFVGRKTITNQTIWEDYNGKRALSLGKSGHGIAEYYGGCIYQAGFDYGNIKYLREDNFNSNSKTIQISILGSGRPQEIKLNIEQ